MLDEGPMHPDMLRDQLDRCRAVFYYPDHHLSPEGRRLALGEFTKALVGIPACFAEQAFDEWRQRGSRAPLIGDVASRAGQLVDDARDRMRAEASKGPPEPPAYDGPDPTEEELATRRAFAQQHVEPLLRKWRDGLHSDDPAPEKRITPWTARPETDAQVAERVRATYRLRYGQDMPGEPTAAEIAAYRQREGIPA